MNGPTGVNCVRVIATSPMLARLTPLLAVAAGVALSLVLVALAVVVALRLRTPTRVNNKHDKHMEQKPPPAESEENNPDVIPLNNGQLYRM